MPLFFFKTHCSNKYKSLLVVIMLKSLLHMNFIKFLFTLHNI